MAVSPPASATRVFTGVLHDVWQWEQERYDGSMATYECVTRQDTAAVIPFLDAETVLLTSQEQPGRDAFWDVPGGRVERGETAEQAAARELEEETGYIAGNVALFRRHDLKGSTRYTRSVCLAKHLTLQPNGASHGPDAGERIQLVPTPWKEVVARCLRGELRSQDAMLAILAMEFDAEARAMKESFLRP